jgi:restriction endonuclease S subunit
MVKSSSEDTELPSSLYRPFFPATWKESDLYSLATWLNGMAFRDFHFTEAGNPVIKIAEIKNGITGQTKFTQSSYDPAYYVKPGDMLFAWSGQPDTSIDVHWWRGEEGWLNQHIFKVTSSPKCTPTFFYYLLKYLRPNFIAIASNKQTTGLGHVTVKDLNSLLVRIPDTKTQRAIAEILGALDDKIEVNRSMNATLESMARAVFRKWFVQNVDVDNWEVKTLGDVLAVLETGSRPKGGVTQEPIGIPSVGAESIVKLGSFDFSKTKYVSGEFYESMRRGHVEDRDVLLYKDGVAQANLNRMFLCLAMAFLLKDFRSMNTSIE